MAKFVKLQSGEWGISAKPGYAAGTTIPVHKSNGSIKRVEIVACLHTAPENAIYTIKAEPRYRVGQLCPACGSEPLNHELSCWECGFSGK